MDTVKRVLIIGGYGNFGSFITKRLAQEANIQVIIAGRSLDKAKMLANGLEATHAPETVQLDINKGFTNTLTEINPDIVIHTSGPFQAQAYDVTNACIAQSCHYIDLADGRVFVENITTLDKMAKDKGVLIMSGASSVLCLTSALVDHYKSEFEALETLDYGITTAQKTARGLATTAAILSYAGKTFSTLVNGEITDLYGWQSLRVRKYPELGWRLLGNCDVPDLALFPKRYPELKSVHFYAGLEMPFVHIALWVLSWLVRIGPLLKDLRRLRPSC